MLQSKLFTRTRKETSKDEVSKNAELLVKGGFVHKEMAGVYSYLPLGLRVLNKVSDIIRSEMNSLGGQEVFLTSLQEKEIWETSGRWDDGVVDNWFKSKLVNNKEVGFANTHEEPLTRLLKQHLGSYKDLPLYVYQIQTKFRNELRAKSGIMRGREFMMKDLYSFSRSEEEFSSFYEQVAKSYLSIFKRVGLGDYTYRTFASGGSFAKFSDEFQTLSDAGEDTIYVDKKKNIAVNKEVYTDDVLKELELKKEDLTEEKSIEVGNIFPLGTRFPEAIGLTYKDKEGKNQYPVMGSYGIGLGRLIGTVVEVLSDEKGIVWPESIAPFLLHIVSVGDNEGRASLVAGDLYKKCLSAGIEVLYDDRDIRAGEKFADADLIGIPHRLIVSERNNSEGKFEMIERVNGESKMIDEKELLSLKRG